MRAPAIALAFGVLAAAPALANDSMSQLGTGGLRFITSQDISMDSEDLTVGPKGVKVVYEFTNHSSDDQKALVAFPLPDITGDGDFMVNVPGEDADNLFGFTTTFNGEPVESTLNQYVFAIGIDRTELLHSLGVPLTPFGQETVAALNALPDADKQNLLHLGMVIPMEYNDGSGWKTDYTPIWTLKSTYSWEAEFKAGETAEVVHTYTPSVGGTVAVTFLAPPYEGEDRAADYAKRYCTDGDFIKTVKKTLTSPEDYYSAPYTESWISYIWSTGANWSGPIGRFHLTIDKGSPKNLVSFCWDGDVKKTGPTTFEMEAKDWYPPWGRELDILILNRNDPAT
ncbi:MAG TPA: DUF4424 domain-containing protein [Devosia sp.]|nr:DUF4424 domain-containing protein [Devosia sp.]